MTRNSLLDKAQQPWSEQEQLKRDNDHLRHLVGLLEKRLEDFEKSAWEWTKKRGGAPKAKGCYFRVAFGDTHGCLIHQESANALLEDLAWLQPKEIILLGDMMDCGGFLAEHHVLGFVADNDYTYTDDVIATNTFLDRVQSASPRSTIDWTEGNHDSRPERWIMNQKLRSKQDVSLLYRMFSTPQVTHCEKRGIKYWTFSGQHIPGNSVRGTIHRGKCYFQHSKVCGQTGSIKLMRQFGGCVVHGNSHAMIQVSERTVAQGEIGAWSPGCLLEFQPTYYRRDPDPWVHGYNLQFVEDDGSFLAINVPFINGRSYLDIFQRLVTGGGKRYGAAKTKASASTGRKHPRKRG